MKSLALRSLIVFGLSSLVCTAIFLPRHIDGPVLFGNAASVFNAYLPLSTTPAEQTFVSLEEILARVTENIDNENISTSSEQTDNSTNTEEEAPSPTINAANIRDAIVNIYCVHQSERYRRLISGTGFMVSPSGAILTNAHVAQFMLLDNAPELGTIDCQVSTLLADSAVYEVELLYISPTWLLEHADLISNPKPTGTGENDFALLYITQATDDSTLPESFPHIPPATNPLYKSIEGNTVILAGYPRQDDNSPRMVATTTITGMYTFASGYADIISLAASDLGHHGASGGPVIDHFGRSIGVISTKDSGTTVLNAITMAHIDRAMRRETGFDLISTLQDDPAAKAALFNETMSPILRGILEENLDE